MKAAIPSADGLAELLCSERKERRRIGSTEPRLRVVLAVLETHFLIGMYEGVPIAPLSESRGQRVLATAAGEITDESDTRELADSLLSQVYAALPDAERH